MTKHLLPFLLVSALACGKDDDSGSSDGTDGTDGTSADGADGTGGDGTDGTSADGTDGTDGTTFGSAFLRVSHLIPDVPGVDIHVNGGETPVITNLEWPNLNPENYVEVPAGTYDFQVALTGTGVDAAALTIEGLTLESDTYYTAMASGSLEAGDLGAIALVDDYTDLPSDSFRVQIVHNAQAVGDVDIWNITDASNPAPLLEDVPFRASAVAELPAGAYSVCFDVDNNATCDVSFDLPELPGGIFLNLVAINDASGNVWLQAQLEDGTAILIEAR
jgi:hypothetical protein